MSRFFSFETLITVDFVQALYFFGMALISIVGILFLLGVSKGIFTMDIPIAGNMRIVGVLLLIPGNLIWRLVCEGWVLLFRMHKSLVEIQNNTETLKRLRKKKI